jgi:hypothetical protein
MCYWAVLRNTIFLAWRQDYLVRQPQYTYSQDYLLPSGIGLAAGESQRTCRSRSGFPGKFDFQFS